MIEEWRKIVGYEGLYEVSSLGRVRSLDRYDSINRFRKGRILKSGTDTGGYLFVQLSSNGNEKNHSVHRLVAEAFIPNPDNLPQVNHIDEDKSNNCVDNLEWCDREYNINYGTIKDRIRNTNLKNGYWSGLSKEEYWNRYRNEHREHLNEYQIEYYQEKKDKICEQHREYYHKNRDKICEQQREYYHKNRDKISEQRRKKRLEKMTIQEKVTSHNDEE